MDIRKTSQEEGKRLIVFIMIFLITVFSLSCYLVWRLFDGSSPGISDKGMNPQRYRIIFRKLEDVEALSQRAQKQGDKLFQTEMKNQWKDSPYEIPYRVLNFTVNEYEKLFKILNERKVTVIEK